MSASLSLDLPRGSVWGAGALCHSTERRLSPVGRADLLRVTLVTWGGWAGTRDPDASALAFLLVFESSPHCFQL